MELSRNILPLARAGHPEAIAFRLVKKAAKLDAASKSAACFPPEWDIHSHFVWEYHRALDSTIQRLVASEPDATALLTLHAWLKEYKSGNEQSLIDDYLKLIVKKLDEWSTNLMRTAVAEFISRAEPPELDADEQYGMEDAVIFFQIVNQGVDAAMERSVDASDRRRVQENDGAPRPVGLVEYVIALANDQIKSADYAEALSAHPELLVSEKYHVIINERFKDAIDGYLDVAKKCTQTLIDIIFNDLRPAAKQIFQGPWYDGIIVQAVETIRDYMLEYQTYLNTSLLELLVKDLLDRFLVRYLTGHANAQKLHMPAG
ncbi:exocyst complex component Sec6-domain-containing protein [Multifurca ochricompacta]|uniref:Exocyst complex component Sec6-domain-containing protein n=1 Tax=Multifurca ochricompacta TaxID=376703 RepID=A0AAD4QRC2_9AGAM|nr:exocyst complex component Sec6-domain-containing protein [Multifurca ochricompacta]